MLKNLAGRVLFALALGLLGGAAIHASGNTALESTARVIEAVGSLWLNALRMTVVPMIFALIVTGVATVMDTAATGRLAARAALFFSVTLVIATAYILIAGPAFYALWPVDPAAAQALVARAGDSPTEIPPPPTLLDWLKTLVPSNPIRAAVEDAILPLIIFAFFFGFATTRLAPEPRAQITGFFRATGDIMITIVRWVLVAAPIGVFALSLGVGLNAGIGAVGVLAQYVTITSLLIIGSVVLMYAVVIVLKPALLLPFAKAVLPVQVLALSTQSSLACLPAMIERARDDLKVTDRTSGLVLPMAVALYRFTSPVGNLAVAAFIAHVYGIELAPLQLVAGGIVAFAVSIASVSLPGQVSFFSAVGPICIALGLPLELLPILLAVEVIPDMFRTVGNVTADVAAAALVDRREEAAASAETA